MKKRIILLMKMVAVAISLILFYVVMNREVEESTDTTNTTNTTYSFAMGTSVVVTLYGIGDEPRANAVEALEDENKKIETMISDLDTRVISWREADSELGQLNQFCQKGQEAAVSDELYTALSLSYKVCQKTEGAVDITIRPLASVWNIEGATEDTFRVPDEDAIGEALGKVDYRQITLNDADRTVSYGQDGMILDLGAVGKGFALDVVREQLKQDRVTGATISVGGSILVYGEKEKGEAFRVGIRNPKGSMEDMIGYLEFPSGSNVCISTSGDYEKYIERDGVRYHHILDCKTGYPAWNDLASVTVVCEGGLYSDALSTACYVLGEEKSAEVLDYFDAEAIFIDKENNISVTEGLQEYWYER